MNSAERQRHSGGDFYVRFWGVRGSVPCPGAEYVRYGGNTACLEIRCGPHLLILDGGTGLRALGSALKAEEPIDCDLFLTHSHIDHINGIPFFGALFNPANRVRLWAGHLKPEHSLKEVICTMMVPPIFPVPIDIFTAQTTYGDFVAGETLTPKPGVTLRTARLNHPNGATGYRVEYDGRAICYVTDTQHVPGQPDRNILGLIAGADIVVYDSTYTDEEFPRFSTWGHSTWEEGLRLVEAAGARKLVIFHHDPSHDDDFMDRIAAAAERARPGTLVAQEGMTLVP